MFQIAIDENRMVVTQKMTLIKTFLRGHYMYNGHFEVASLVYIYVYICRFKNDLFPCGENHTCSKLQKFQ